MKSNRVVMTLIRTRMKIMIIRILTMHNNIRIMVKI